MSLSFIEPIPDSSYARIVFEDFIESVIDLKEFPEIKLKKSKDLIAIDGTIEAISFPDIYIGIHHISL